MVLCVDSKFSPALKQHCCGNFKVYNLKCRSIMAFHPDVQLVECDPDVNMDIESLTKYTIPIDTTEGPGPRSRS